MARTAVARTAAARAAGAGAGAGGAAVGARRAARAACVPASQQTSAYVGIRQQSVLRVLRYEGTWGS